jgi:hypothetical protein
MAHGHRWPVAGPPSAEDRWTWTPRGLAELPAIRAELRRRLGHGAPASDDAMELHEQLVLLMDELLSNALRHGAPPVAGAVRRTADAWLLVVSDGAEQAPPHPDPERDPSRGGLGLRMVADLSAAYGWCSDGGLKHVWALVAAG